MKPSTVYYNMFSRIKLPSKLAGRSGKYQPPKLPANNTFSVSEPPANNSALSQEEKVGFLVNVVFLKGVVQCKHDF